MAELRKVVWPTRSELITYTTVVIVFVGLFAAAVLLFDLGVARVVSGSSAADPRSTVHLGDPYRVRHRTRSAAVEATTSRRDDVEVVVADDGAADAVSGR